MRTYYRKGLPCLILVALLFGSIGASAQTPVGPLRAPDTSFDLRNQWPEPPSSSDIWDPALLESFFDGIMAIQLDQYASPGAMVAVVKDGEILLAKGYGYADQERGIAVDAQTTMFRPGSNSKLFIWTAVLQLVEQGLLDLDEPVTAYLDFPLPSQLRDGRAGGDITMRHLMTHTAGFEDVMAAVFVDTLEMVRPLGEYLRDIPARVYPAGEISAYSNYGSSLAAYVVERISGQPFAEYVEENIFVPLGMAYSTFAQPIPEHLADQMAVGYLYQNGRAVPAGFEWVQSYPAGGLSSSAQDMAVFMLAQLAEGSYRGTQILQPETVAQLHEQAFTQDPRLPGMTLGLIEGQSHGQRFLAHGGDTLQMHTGLWLFPEENLGLYLSYNGAATVWARLVALQAFLDRCFPENGSEPELAAQDFHDPGPYLGAYFPARSNYSGFESLLRLAQPFLLSSDADENLLARTMGSQRKFQRNAEGLWATEDGSVTFAAGYGEDGRAVALFFGDPMPYVRAAWYESPMFLYPLLGGGILWFLVFFIHCLRRLFRVKGRGDYWQRWPFWLPMLLFTTALGVLLAMGIWLAVDISEVYDLPRLFFTPLPDLFVWISVVVGIMGAAAVVLLVSSLLAWPRPRIRLRDKVYYTASAVWALALVGFLYYTNLFTW